MYNNACSLGSLDCVAIVFVHVFLRNPSVCIPIPVQFTGSLGLEGTLILSHYLCLCTLAQYLFLKRLFVQTNRDYVAIIVLSIAFFFNMMVPFLMIITKTFHSY